MRKPLRLSRRLRLTVVIVAVSLVLLGAVALQVLDVGIVYVPIYTDVYLGGWRDIPFKSAEWQAADGLPGQLWSRGPQRDNRRAKMVNDLMANHLHRGLPQEQAESLLGKASGVLDEDIFYYSLLAWPDPDQQLVAWMRYRTTSPSLVVAFEGGRLCEVRVGE